MAGQCILSCTYRPLANYLSNHCQLQLKVVSNVIWHILYMWVACPCCFTLQYY